MSNLIRALSSCISFFVSHHLCRLSSIRSSAVCTKFGKGGVGAFRWDDISGGFGSCGRRSLPVVKNRLDSRLSWRTFCCSLPSQLPNHEIPQVTSWHVLEEKMILLGIKPHFRVSIFFSLPSWEIFSVRHIIYLEYQKCIPYSQYSASWVLLRLQKWI